ncbi:MAG: hypothetical protein OEY05_03915 [Paracoccaceae bacterium]|nr:hypothetical protein [Paracoccaceae bacterium]
MTIAPVPSQNPNPAAARQASAPVKPPAAKPAQGRPAGEANVRPLASPAKTQTRHRGVLASFILLVLLPAFITAGYLWTFAEDQFASYGGFSVHKEETGSAIDLIGGISALSGGTSSTSDADVLYEFIQSQDLVHRIDQKLDLRGVWSKAEGDPVFAYDPPGTIEDLLAHWQRKVSVTYDNGMITLRVLAFDPMDAKKIAEAIFDESTVMINRLNDVARTDALRYAREELETAVERLKSARQAITEFRNRTQIVDPTSDVQGQIGLLATLQQQLAEALIEKDILAATANAADPRLPSADLRISVIEERIRDERRKLGIGEGGEQGDAFASIVGEYESLAVDREFAEQSYVSALATYDGALAEAGRKSRYLAAYVNPTLAESSEFPQREILFGSVTMLLLLVWAIGVLIFYSLRDRR